MTNIREGFEVAVVNMITQGSPYFNDYVFYMHLIAQCKVVFDDNLSAPAAVSFQKNTYILYINPSMYNHLSLVHRIGILKHEMLHIALGHLFRIEEDTNLKAFNYATDCALNQKINREHLPKGCIYPDNYPAKEAANHLNETAEFYYNLLEIDPTKDSAQGDENGDGDPTSGKEGFDPGDAHKKWKEVKGDPFIQQEITKNMLEKAADKTIKSRGNLPSDYAEMLENITRSDEVNWKKELTRVVGNKKANSRKTIMRKDRRMPTANWIKGRTKDRIFELAVISDVSGSVATTHLYHLWAEILNICNMFSTPVTLVQVDTQPSAPVVLDKSTKAIERTACGGTFLSPAIDTLKEHGIAYNALVITTDGYLSESDLVPFSELKVPVIWLIAPTGEIMEGMNQGNMKAIKLTERK